MDDNRYAVRDGAIINVSENDYLAFEMQRARVRKQLSIEEKIDDIARRLSVIEAQLGIKNV